MTVQIQEQKWLTISEIAPIWAEMIRTNTRLDGFSLGFYDKCVVGEAYGFDDHYAITCDECSRIGMRFNYADPLPRRASDGEVIRLPLRDYPSMWGYGYKGESIEEVVSQFEEHWNTCHNVGKETLSI